MSHDGLLFLITFEIREIRAVATAGAGNRVSLFVEFHAEVETHAVEDLLDLVERLLAEVLRREHLALSALDEVANSANVGVLQAIVRTDRKLEFVDGAIQLVI